MGKPTPICIDDTNTRPNSYEGEIKRFVHLQYTRVLLVYFNLDLNSFIIFLAVSRFEVLGSSSRIK
jgi:hypothetical protein